MTGVDELTEAEKEAIAAALVAWESEHSSAPRWSALGWRQCAVDPMLNVLDRLGYEIRRVDDGR